MRKWLAELFSISCRKRKEKDERVDIKDGANSPGLWHRRTAYLYNLVFLGFVDLASQAAAGDGVMDNELVGLKTWLLVQLWTCVTRHFSRVCQHCVWLIVFAGIAQMQASSTDLCTQELRRGRK